MKRGLGKGKGFEVIREYSLLNNGGDPELLDKITDRVAQIYDMLYEEEPDNEELDYTEEDWKQV